MKGLLTIILAIAAAAAIGTVTSVFKLPFPLPDLPDIFAYTYKYDNGGNFTAGDTTLNSSIKNLDIDWVTGSVTVEYHDEDTVIVKETSNVSLDNDTKLRWQLEGDTLTVKFAKSGARIKSNTEKHIVITLPADTEGGTAKIKNTTGEIYVKGGIWNELNTNTTTGSVSVSSDRTDKFFAKTTTGSVNADIYSAGVIDMHCTTGDIYLSAGSFDTLNASVTTGKVTAKLPEKPGFTAKLSTVTGDVRCGLTHTDSDKTYIIGDGSKSVEIKAVTGDIEITG